MTPQEVRDVESKANAEYLTLAKEKRKAKAIERKRAARRRMRRWRLAKKRRKSD